MIMNAHKWVYVVAEPALTRWEVIIVDVEMNSILICIPSLAMVRLHAVVY